MINPNDKLAVAHATAILASTLAAKAENAALGPEQSRGFDCGFGWVELRPATHPFVRYLKASGAGDKHWKSGWQLWGSRLHEEPTQSISVHYAAAVAYVKSVKASLADDSLTIFANSRYD